MVVSVMSYTNLKTDCSRDKDKRFLFLLFLEGARLPYTMKFYDFPYLFENSKIIEKRISYKFVSTFSREHHFNQPLNSYKLCLV